MKKNLALAEVIEHSVSAGEVAPAVREGEEGGAVACVVPRLVFQLLGSPYFLQVPHKMHHPHHADEEAQHGLH